MAVAVPRASEAAPGVSGGFGPGGTAGLGARLTPGAPSADPSGAHLSKLVTTSVLSPVKWDTHEHAHRLKGEMCATSPAECGTPRISDNAGSRAYVSLLLKDDETQRTWWRVPRSHVCVVTRAGGTPGPEGHILPHVSWAPVGSLHALPLSRPLALTPCLLPQQSRDSQRGGEGGTPDAARSRARAGGCEGRGAHWRGFPNRRAVRSRIYSLATTSPTRPEAESRGRHTPSTCGGTGSPFVW